MKTSNKQKELLKISNQKRITKNLIIYIDKLQAHIYTDIHIHIHI